MRVLLTGASGFVGRAAIAPLVASGCDLHAVSRRAPADGQGAHWHRADLLKADETRALIAELRPEIVLHLAWCVEHGRFWTDPANLDWIAATMTLARAAAQAGASRFVAAGTCYEYDWPEAGDCNERDTPLAGHTLYDTSKDATRRVLEAFCADRAMSFAWARLFFLYGPGEAQARLVASLARALTREEEAPMSRGLAIRDFIDVRDAGAALSALALSQVTGPVNIGTGKEIGVAELALKLGELSGRPDLVRLGALPDRIGEPPRIVADIGRLRSEVGYSPSTTLESGLRNVLDFWASDVGKS
ncbi:MAG: NAD(P)-dependent oxidoreductase [Alphaproteobacteria bacterium HGW-Alphaproteobacteria-12]|nr:MAG: NAD(P)-dependent oxidoreductase [Alphaproteobacteria bacterium HGW-Alphaproteobacteria-12]